MNFKNNGRVMRELGDLVNESKLGMTVQVPCFSEEDATALQEFYRNYEGVPVRFLGYSLSDKIVHLTKKINLIGDYLDDN